MSGHAPIVRGRFDGVWQILRFNYPMFAGAAVALAAGGAMIAWGPGGIWVKGAVGAGMGLGAFWAAATLAVSHWVYDVFPTFELGWARAHLPKEVRRWANVHSGFDQTSGAIAAAFPAAVGVPVDLFDPEVMTEKSIRRARRYHGIPAGTLAGRADRLPVGDGEADAVFVLFAAHELRKAEERAALFREAGRAMGSAGALVVVEHLRGAANLAAFGPGAFHFFGHREWVRAGEAAGLELAAEVGLTPFATAFVWRNRT